MAKKTVKEYDHAELLLIVETICDKWRGITCCEDSIALYKIVCWLQNYAPDIKIKKHPEIVRCAYDVARRD